jgi:hypothetical protein
LFAIDASPETDRLQRRWFWREVEMMDLIYLGLVLVFFGLSWALVTLCERL